jgi:aspartyl-tRNA(Asn)/glutamyl-tRNA(Gln) amidotransferase subunit A
MPGQMLVCSRNENAYLVCGLGEGHADCGLHPMFGAHTGSACYSFRMSSSVSMSTLSITEAARGLRAGSCSSEELTRECLDRIERFNPTLNAYITVDADRAIAAAKQVDRAARRDGWQGPVQGIPLAIKDNIDTADLRTTAGSRVFGKRIPAKDAVVVSRLRSAGAVILGKTNMHEIAIGTTSAISSFGPVRNPHDPTRVTGGSSGGSAAAVAAGLCLGALGTDTGGSVRIPAAACGIVGFKPTYGVVETAGLMYASESFDHIGPMTVSVTDAALLLGAMSAHPAACACDPHSWPPVKPLRVGVLEPELVCSCALEPEVAQSVENAIEVLRGLVTAIVPARLPTDRRLSALIAAEAYQHFAQYAQASPEAFDPRIRKHLQLDGPRPAVDTEKMRTALARFRSAASDAFSEFDVVVCPTLPTLPIPISEAEASFALGYCTFEFNLAGLPSISVPCGYSSAGLPIGLQISGPAFTDARVLALACAYEAATRWRTAQ